jgi:hypothetical protein
LDLALRGDNVGKASVRYLVFFTMILSSCRSKSLFQQPSNQLIDSFLQGLLYLSFDISKIADSLGGPEQICPTIQFLKQLVER